MHTPRPARAPLALLTSALLMACGQGAPSTPAASSGQAAPRYDYVASLLLEPGDTPASVAHAVGGSVLAWDDAGCTTADADHCTALIGLQGARGTTARGVHALTGDPGRTVYIEPNRDVFSGGGTITAVMGGARTMWAGGDISAWAGGARTMWAGGTFNLLPQNTALWTTLHLQEAQALAPKLGAGVTVAIIDTGLDLNHPAFQGALADPSTWWDFYAGDAVPQDEGTLGVGGYGHGTNVAGIVLQIAPEAKIMPLRVLGPDGSGDVATVAQAITWAVAHGANVINLSLGATTDSKVVNDAIKKAVAQNVLVTTSAGNDNLDKITFPAAQAKTFKTGLSVSSVNLQGQKSSFANYSDKVELSAPGENVYAPAPGNMMAAWSGTSMAAPMAAGAFALALGQTLKISVMDLPIKMIDNTANIYANNLNQPYKDKLGKGRVDLSAFLKAVL